MVYLTLPDGVVRTAKYVADQGYVTPPLGEDGLPRSAASVAMITTSRTGSCRRSVPGRQCLSGQSLVAAYVEGLPFEKRLGLDPLLKGGVGGQERPVDFPSVQQQI